MPAFIGTPDMITVPFFRCPGKCEYISSFYRQYTTANDI